MKPPTKPRQSSSAFYGDAIKRSYFSSCSNGGRQALMEAQRYPGDYDGIIAGAPAYYWTHLLTAALWDMTALLNDPASYIPASKLPLVEGAALQACDANDGVKDGVIDDPTMCHFTAVRAAVQGRRVGYLSHGAAGDRARKDLRRRPQRQRRPGFSGLFTGRRIRRQWVGRLDQRRCSRAEPAVRVRRQLFPEHAVQRSEVGLSHVQLSTKT